MCLSLLLFIRPLGIDFNFTGEKKWKHQCVKVFRIDPRQVDAV